MEARGGGLPRRDREQFRLVRTVYDYGGTMSEKRYRGAGKFVWHELLTTDLQGSRSYYGELFGWSYKEIYRGHGEDYLVFGKDGEDLGGFVAVDGADGETSRWLPYVTVESADEAAQNTGKLGGKVLTPPRDVRGFGRSAVLEDPAGARVAVLSDGDPEEDLYEGPPRPGTFVWNDALSRDPQKAALFYCGLVGWMLFSMELENQGQYLLLRRGEVNEGGLILKPESAEGPSTWLPYVAVENLEKECDRAVQLGGSMAVPPTDLHGAGHYAVTADPSGALLALLTLAV
jgi:hypothetical protein